MRLYFENILNYILIVTFLFFVPDIALASPADGKAMEGMDLYRKKAFNQASQKFMEAHNGKPNDPKISYNLGNSQYKQGKFEKALNNYSFLLDPKNDTKIKQNSAYNMGNALYRMGKLEESIASYKKALELDPSDMDSKFNLEFVRKKNLEKQKDQHKKNQSEKNKKDQDSTEKKEQNKNHNESFQQEQDSKETSSNQKIPQNKKEKNKTQNSQPKKSESVQASISKENAEQKLNALTEDLKKFQRKQAIDMKSLFNYKGNDW